MGVSSSTSASLAAGSSARRTVGTEPRASGPIEALVALEAAYTPRPEWPCTSRPAAECAATFYAARFSGPHRPARATVRAKPGDFFSPVAESKLTEQADRAS